MEDQATTTRTLEVLPRCISDTNRRLGQAIEKLWRLEEFLFGSQPSDCEEEEKKLSGGLIDKCFDNLGDMTKSVEECHKRLEGIMSKLGIPEGDKEPLWVNELP